MQKKRATQKKVEPAKKPEVEEKADPDPAPVEAKPPEEAPESKKPVYSAWQIRHMKRRR